MIRRLLQLSLLAMIVVLALLAFGDRIIRRPTPGVRLVYAVRAPQGYLSAARDVADALRERLAADDLHQLTFTPQGNDRVEILVPSFIEVGEVKRALRVNGILEFAVLVESEKEPGAAEMQTRLRESGPAPQAGDTMRWLEIEIAKELGPGAVQGNYQGKQYLLVYAKPPRAMIHDPYNDWGLRGAHPIVDPRGARGVAFELDDRGAQLFGDLTEVNVNKPLAIILDGVVLSTPTVRGRIGGSGVINGDEPTGFSEKEANYLSSILNAGTLPATLSHEPLTQETTTLTLGMPPLIRWMLKGAAVLLAFALIVLGVLWMLDRRGAKPTPTAGPYSRSGGTGPSGSS